MFIKGRSDANPLVSFRAHRDAIMNERRRSPRRRAYSARRLASSGGEMTDNDQTIWGASKPKSTWFGGACVAHGGLSRSRFLGSIYGASLGRPPESDNFSEELGVMNGPLSGELALSHLGPTAAERADDRVRARPARVDATLAGVGVRPRRRRSGL
jgi:hypothetical protein